MSSPIVLPYASVILKLLQGVLYQDDKQWELLMANTRPVEQHFSAIGLRLLIDEAEGYAYLVQPEQEDDAQPLPRLMRRTRLGYEATLLTVLLREELQRADMNQPSARLVLSKAQIYTLMALFFQEEMDVTRLNRRLDSVINQVVRAGFLRPFRSASEEEVYEVRRIIKARVPADKLAEIRDRLLAHSQEEELT